MVTSFGIFFDVAEFNLLFSLNNISVLLDRAKNIQDSEKEGCKIDSYKRVKI